MAWEELEPIEDRICQDCGSEQFHIGRHELIVCSNCCERYKPFNTGLLHKAMMNIGAEQ